VKLFEDNAKAKLTDEQISKAIKKNFPGRDSAVFDHVAAIRNRYNKGILTKGVLPKVPSVRYGEDGETVSARGKTKVVKKTKKSKKA
jgi:hypothetical protein